MRDEDEINLIDYIKVVLKRKRLIFGIALGAAIIAGSLSYITPKTYEINTILEVGQMEEFIPESPTQLVEKIKNGNYDETIKTKLNIEIIPLIDISSPADTRLVIMSIKSQEPDNAKKILEELENLILEKHQKKFNLQKNILLDDKKRIKNKISSLENEKKILEEKVKYLTSLMARTPSPTNQFLLSEAKISSEKKKSEIEEQHLELNSIERKLNSYEATNVIKEPLIPTTPTGSGIVMNTAIALIFGIFIGTILAFSVEWWKKEKIAEQKQN